MVFFSRSIKVYKYNNTLQRRKLQNLVVNTTLLWVSNDKETNSKDDQPAYQLEKSENPKSALIQSQARRRSRFAHSGVHSSKNTDILHPVGWAKI